MSASSSAAAPPSPAVGDDEKLSLLLDEKTLSDMESEAGRAELDSRFPSSWSSTSRRVRSFLSAAGTCVSRSASWRAAVVRVALFLVPSFIPHRLSGVPAKRAGRPDRLSPTAYLDGMRGVAAFAVFFCHYFYTCFRIAEGYGHGDNNYNFLKLPFVRLWYQGPPMVCVFFVISGYALSLKPLKLARAAASGTRPSSPSSPSSMEAFSTTMSSFVFRRFFRLFLPTAASTLLIALLLRIGAYEWTRDLASDPLFMRNVQETHPERLASLSAQLYDWAAAMFAFVHVWDWQQFGGSTSYDVHLWTIPVEFRCSMVLFVSLVGVARLRTGVRLAVLVILGLFCYRSDRWEMLLFYCGTILAELDLIRRAHGDPSTTAAVASGAGGVLPTSMVTTEAAPAAPAPPIFDPTPAIFRAATSELSFPSSPRPRPLRKLFWGLLSILALYLMCQPDVGGEATPGWVFLTSLVPDWWTDKYRYWQTIGSVLFVAAVARLPRWQRVFNAAPAQYLGRISYAVYLVHGPVLHTVGYATERRAWALVGSTGGGEGDSEGRFVGGFVLAAVVVVPAVVWAADVFWRAVDAPTVRFAKWLEAKCVVGE